MHFAVVLPRAAQLSTGYVRLALALGCLTHCMLHKFADPGAFKWVTTLSIVGRKLMELFSPTCLAWLRGRILRKWALSPTFRRNTWTPSSVVMRVESLNIEVVVAGLPHLLTVLIATLKTGAVCPETSTGQHTFTPYRDAFTEWPSRQNDIRCVDA